MAAARAVTPRHRAERPFELFVHADATRRHAAPQQRATGGLAFVREMVVIVVFALALSWLVKTFFAQAFFIPSESMQDTLIKHDRIVVNKLAPGPFDLHRGDVVVFKDPGGWLGGVEGPPQSTTMARLDHALTYVGLYPQDAGQHLVKRVIGVPGDRVACASPDSPVTVNGVAVHEPYLAAGATPCDFHTFDVTVPANSLWVMGDNRQNSADSRFHLDSPSGGFVPMANVVGVAFATVWPFDRAEMLHNPGATFAAVPAPGSGSSS
jgi:signal peptidase I